MGVVKSPSEYAGIEDEFSAEGDEGDIEKGAGGGDEEEMLEFITNGD